MDIVAVDFGSYCIKVMEFSTHGGHLVLHDYQKWQTPKDSDPQKALFTAYQLLKNHLGDDAATKKVIFQLPPRMFTVRYQSFPRVAKKKIKQMLPFQLEESLPFALADVHYASVLIESGHQTKALTNIVTLEDFRPIYDYCLEQSILPQVLTTEVFVWQNLVQNELAARPTAFPVAYGILDLGHKYTKAYFFQQQTLEAYHEEQIGGATLDEILITTYGKSPAEITAYKEKNGYLLSEEQIASLEEDQANFVRLLNNALNPLLQNLRAWLLSFRSKHDAAVEAIYLVGGTSKIHNVANYLAQYLGIEVKPLDVYGEDVPEQLTPSERVDYALAFALGRAASASIAPGNLLTQNFAPHLQSEVALPSALFVAVRVFIVTLLLLIGMGIDYHFAAQTRLKLREQVAKQIERSEFAIPKKERNQLLKNLPKLAKKLQEKNNAINKAVRNMQHATRENPLQALSNMLTIGGLKQAQLESLTREGDLVRGDISATSEDALLVIEQQMREQGWPKPDLDTATKHLNFHFEIKGGK
ncbi:MAG: pilus assembly protein PilM [Bacteriovoracaceae bacterium]|nr:pilus assembly protein PilM [Bacteriovoracaceae bacterium]